MTTPKRGRKPLAPTSGILELIEEYWVELGPQRVLDMARELRPTLTLTNLRNYYHQLARAGKVKNHVPYKRVIAWDEDSLREIRAMAEDNLSAADIAKNLGVRRWAVLAACSAHGIRVRRKQC